MREDVLFVPAAEFSPVEVVGAFLERMEGRNQEIKAYVTMIGDGNTTGRTRGSGEVGDPLTGPCMTYQADFTGHPAASVPAGFTRGGPPVGMRLVGRRFDEAAVPAAGAAFERMRPWEGSCGTGSHRDGKGRQHA